MYSLDMTTWRHDLTTSAMLPNVVGLHPSVSSVRFLKDFLYIVKRPYSRTDRHMLQYCPHATRHRSRQLLSTIRTSVTSSEVMTLIMWFIRWWCRRLGLRQRDASNSISSLFVGQPKSCCCCCWCASLLAKWVTFQNNGRRHRDVRLLTVARSRHRNCSDEL